MAEHNIESIMNVTLENLKAMVDADTIIGTPINVGEVKDIPKDYYGKMGVPISFLSSYCTEQFEIIGLPNKDNAEEMGVKPVGKEWCDIYFGAGGTGHMSPGMRNPVLLINGVAKSPYNRIIIQRKVQGGNGNESSNI